MAANVAASLIARSRPPVRSTFSVSISMSGSFSVSLSASFSVSFSISLSYSFSFSFSFSFSIRFSLTSASVSTLTFAMPFRLPNAKAAAARLDRVSLSINGSTCSLDDDGIRRICINCAAGPPGVAGLNGDGNKGNESPRLSLDVRYLRPPFPSEGASKKFVAATAGGGAKAR